MPDFPCKRPARVAAGNVQKPVIAVNHDTLTIDHLATKLIVSIRILPTPSNDYEARDPGIDPHQPDAIPFF